MNTRAILGAAIALLMGAPACPASTRDHITYEMFGARGDGVTDDMKAIVAAHEAANEQGLPVRVAARTYYIGGAALTAVVKTDTDFGEARFIIDDRNVEDRTTDIFDIRSYMEPYEIEGMTSLAKGSGKLGVRLPCESLVEIWNEDKRIYIREGPNQNSGVPQREMLVASRSGRISRLSEVIWQYDKVTKAKAYPIDGKTLTVRGGHFTTIANTDESRYTYYSRGIQIGRSSTVLEGLEHHVEGEADHGAPYTGFISISHAADVTVRDCILTGHKTYTTIGSAGVPVSMGTYDLNIYCAVGVKVQRCTQTNDLDDRTYWGLMGSNFCKSLTFEGCRITRFDAHQGVWNVTLRDCVFGHMFARAVGCGTLTIERCEMRYGYLFGLRDDYGSSWDGDIYIKDCILRPVMPETHSVEVIHGSNRGLHDFGYDCRLPRRIVVDGLTIDDSRVTNPGYKGPALFAPFEYAPDAMHPVPAEGKIVLRNISVASGRPFVISHNASRFAGYEVVR